MLILLYLIGLIATIVTVKDGGPDLPLPLTILFCLIWPLSLFVGFVMGAVQIVREAPLRACPHD